MTDRPPPAHFRNREPAGAGPSPAGRPVLPETVLDRGPSAAVREKALRLLAEGRVKALLHDHGSVVCQVDGDTGRYLTIVLDPEWPRLPDGLPRSSCTCEAGRAGHAVCSHVEAVRLTLQP